MKIKLSPKRMPAAHPCRTWLQLTAPISALLWAASICGAETQSNTPTLDQLQPRIDAALNRSDLSAYRGWIKFLRFEAANAAARQGTNREPPAAKTARLADWLGRIEANPDLLATLRGVQEWAYESPVDDSGQPFKLVIPSDFDPTRRPGLSVYLHGYSGNHMEHSTGFHPHPGNFEMAVLGRARGGWYTALSEEDVLQAIDYVQKHWSVDPDRIQLNGGSMGGGGTLRLASHYPHQFASGRITCGYGADLPMANLLAFPVYATHSADDPTVPILTSRGPLNYLRELGGQVIFDETNGFGHAVWNYAEGNLRGTAWESNQVRLDSRQVRHLDFTALTGRAARSWWAEITEWGSAPRPARFILVAGRDNTLYAELRNINRLRLRLLQSPFDLNEPLRISVGGAVPFEISAPLPDSLVLVKDTLGWRRETKTESHALPLHTPGGPILLYDGSPLLIVYGTHGPADVCDAMRKAAEAASKSPNPGWASEGGEAGSDGVPHHQNLYGQLKVKADRDVNDRDLNKCHLVLIGTAAQNSLVARVATRLPVQLKDGKIVCNDGLEVDAARRGLGLVHYNPLSPQRLIYWVASDLASAYTPQNPIVQLSATRLTGADLVVMELNPPRLVLTRSFDSRWGWQSERAMSPLLPANLEAGHRLAFAVAEAIRLEAGAQFAVVTVTAPGTAPTPLSAPFVPGITRLADTASLAFFNPIGVMDVSGAQLLKLYFERMRSVRNSTNEVKVALCPSVETGKIDSARSYRLAIAATDVQPFAQATKSADRTFRMTDLQVSEALEHFLVPAAETAK